MHEKISQSCFSFVKYPISSSKLWEIPLSVFLVLSMNSFKNSSKYWLISWNPIRPPFLLSANDLLSLKKKKDNQAKLSKPFPNFPFFHPLIPVSWKTCFLSKGRMYLPFSSFIFLWHFEMLCYFKHLHPLHPHSSVLWLITLAKL